MNRRSFIKNSSVLGVASMLPLTSFSLNDSPKFKMGYQLFSIRDQMAKDPKSTLEYLKGLGYEDFEIYGFDAEKGSYYGYASQAFKELLDQLGLTVSSGHYNFSPYLDQSDAELAQFVDRCIEGAHTLNSKYITLPWIAPEQRTIDGYKLLAAQMNAIGEQVTKAGLGFAYHNHGYEFEDQNGENGFDILVNETDPALVKLQMDMYWVVRSSKYTPQELIRKQPKRYTMWHIKDMDKLSRDYTELGNGSIDYEAILPDPKESGLEFYYIEQGGNYSENSLKSAASNAQYFRRRLQRYL
ncbi:sugar phosphate isomerase/epimerase family protein [Arenibacter lacus]|uniref:sugar phosphate isomerase/epimerase family protein n=1 Tax=Arenibacter lacus TaxID=2608629 RepID=UPI001CC54015|nr:sugar phosphate isomerase/epimerase [Arenibacter lacus]